MPSDGKTAAFSLFSQVVNCLLQTNVTDENIGDTKEEKKIFSQVRRNTLLQYTEALLAEEIRCEDVYEKNSLKDMSIRERDKPICRTQ